MYDGKSEIKHTDDFADILDDAKIVAILECKDMFFGLRAYKPKEIVIITGRALQFVPSDKIKFVIPMKHVKKVHVDFSPDRIGFLMIHVTKQYAAHIESIIRTAENCDLLTDNTNFTSAVITLVSENLNDNTKNNLRILLPRMADMKVELTAAILQYLGIPRPNQPTNPLNQKQNSLTPLTPSSFLPARTDEVTEESTLVENGESAVDFVLPEAAMVENTRNSPTRTTINSDITITSVAGTETTASDTISSHPCDDNRILLTYQYGDGSLSLTVGDYMCLTSEQFLNDKIIDFYLKYIENEIIPTERVRQRTHIFSSFFYHVLTTSRDLKPKTDGRTDAQRRHDRVKNWTKYVNIFEKDFIIVPVMEREHWYVVIICFANMLLPVNGSPKDEANVNDGIVRQPVILLFNSMASTANYRVNVVLRDYLTCEYMARMPHCTNPPSFTKDTLPGHRIKVPQQSNLYDCGLYVLQYVEEFFRKPIRDFHTPINELEHWFDPFDIVSKRENLAKLIERLMKDQHAMMGTTPQVKLPNIPFPTLNGELVSIEIADVNDVEMIEKVPDSNV